SKSANSVRSSVCLPWKPSSPRLEDIHSNRKRRQYQTTNKRILWLCIPLRNEPLSFHSSHTALAAAMCSSVPKRGSCTSLPIPRSGLRGWPPSPHFVLWANLVALVLVGGTIVVPIAAGMPSELFIRRITVST